MTYINIKFFVKQTVCTDCTVRRSFFLQQIHTNSTIDCIFAPCPLSRFNVVLLSLVWRNRVVRTFFPWGFSLVAHILGSISEARKDVLRQMGGLGDVLRPGLHDVEDFDLRFAPRVLHSTVHHGHRKRQRIQRWQSLPASFSLNFKELNPLFPHTEMLDWKKRLLHTKRQGIEGLCYFLQSTSILAFFICSSWRNMQRIQSAMHIDGQLELIHEEILASLLALHNRANLPTCLRPSYGLSREWICVCCFSRLLNWQSGDFSIVGLLLDFS